jgi:hypothetical protein
MAKLEEAIEKAASIAMVDWRDGMVSRITAVLIDMVDT